jgi:hypothetical protein
MSLLRLLAAGKSLIGLKQQTKQYRDLGPGALPKFEGKKNVFRSSPQSDNSTQPDSSKIPAASSEGSPRTTPMPQKDSHQPAQPTSWRRKVSGLWSIKSKPAVPRFDKALVQTELSLDRVKVVRNDLLDSDLEVVSAVRAVSKPKQVRQVTKAPEPAPPAVTQGEELIGR